MPRTRTETASKEKLKMDNTTIIRRCFAIIRHTTEFPKLVRLCINLSDENVAWEFIDVMKREASNYLVLTNNDFDRESVRLFHAMLLGSNDNIVEEEKEEVVEEEYEDTQLKGDDGDDGEDDKTLTNKERESPYVRKLYSILDDDDDDEMGKIPVCVRNAIENDVELNEIAETFYRKVEWCCSHEFFYKPSRRYPLCSLDSNQDTEKEVGFTMNFFPYLLNKENFINSRVGLQFKPYYAVNRAAKNVSNACNVKSVSFVPVLAKVGLEILGRTTQVSNNRGGLLSYCENDMNVLRYLANSTTCNCCNSRSRGNTTSDSDSDSDSGSSNAASTTQSDDIKIDYSEEEYEEHQIHIDEINLSVIKKLREQNLFYKEDIQREDLMECLLCCCKGKDNTGSISSSFYFAERRFRYLVDWDPISLTKERNNQIDGKLPLHLSIQYNYNFNSNTRTHSTRGFRSVLDAGIRHFPTKVGFLFHKDIKDRTPFQMACKIYGKEVVMQIVDDVVTTAITNSSSSTFMETLITAAIDETIHLDCIFFLLRKEPSVLLQTSYVSNEDEDRHNPMRTRTIPKMAATTTNQQQKRKRYREIISKN
jgi:hypothetical protein